MVADELSRVGIECEVINVSSIKPLDGKIIVQSAKKTGKVVTIEDHQVMGGMGSAVAELLSREYPAPIKFLGVQDRFGVSGPWEEVYKVMGLDRESIKQAVVDYLHL
ncbi:MAG: transketolase C-terminal domain-containing protein [bacterium]